MRPWSSVAGMWSRSSPEQRLAGYNAVIVSIGALFAAIAWLPDYQAKNESVEAFSLIKDNPSGVLNTRLVKPLANGLDLFDVSYELTLKNTSNKAFTVEFSIDRLFLGTNHYVPSRGAAERIEDPPGIWDTPSDHSETATVDWKLIGSKTSVIGDDDEDLFRANLDRRLIGNGLVPRNADGSPAVSLFDGMTGVYAPDHTTGYAAHFYVVARSQDFVSVSITYSLRSKVHFWDRWFGTSRTSFDNANPNSETVWLSDVVREKCAYGVNTTNDRTEPACGSARPDS